MDSIITYFGEHVKVVCDGNCKKAWGVNSRPRVYKEIPGKIFGLQSDSEEANNIYPDNEDIDCENYAYLADCELHEAPIDPKTYECGHAKPTDLKQFPNKWCVRECERSSKFKISEDVELKDFSKRFYNIEGEKF